MDDLLEYFALVNYSNKTLHLLSMNLIFGKNSLHLENLLLINLPVILIF